MSTKLKKYLFLIPTLFVMLVNCVCYGQVIFSANAIDYNEYFKPVEDCPHTFDFTDVDSILNKFQQKDYYFYAVYMTASEYENYISGSSYTVSLTYFDFDSDIPLYDSSFIVHYYGIYGRCSFTYDSSSDKYSNFVSPSVSYGQNLVYYKNTGSYYVASNIYFSVADYDNQDYCNERYYYYQCTNIPDFPLFFDYEAADSALNVDVVFNPNLSGTVDRSMIAEDGSTYLRSNFTMVVYNHCKYPIQYTMDIRPVASHTDFVFRYYENDWVYAPKIDSAGDFWNQIPQKQQKATNCHYVLSGRTDVVNFNFNQINLIEGVEYVVEVYAARNDYGYASELAVSSVEEVYPELYQVQNTLVYQSQFSMKQYSDVKYDPTNTSNGVLPYDFELGQKYEHSYNAVEKEDGEVDYTGKDVYSDKDSWYHNPIDDNTQGGSFSSSTTSSNGFSNFAKSFQNFFGFIRYMFNFFPKEAKTIFTIGFSAITIIALVKVLFKS